MELNDRFLELGVGVDELRGLVVIRRSMKTSSISTGIILEGARLVGGVAGLGMSGCRGDQRL
jgi:hypothetical protein